MLHELRLAARSLLRSPVLSTTIVAILALAIGANTAIFSVLEGLLLRPLPLHQPDRLVRLYEEFGTGTGEQRTAPLSEITLRQWQQNNPAFSDIAAATVANLTMTGGREPVFVQGSRISANLLPVLGVQPILGRNFSAEEDRPNGARVALIGHAFWQRTLAGNADVLGSTITFDGQLFTIVGVLPAGFNHPYRADVWIPLAAAFDPAAPRANYLYAPARLRDGVTLEQAATLMREFCARTNAEQKLPTNPTGASFRQLHDGFVRDLRPKLIAIAGAALFVLLIAAANVASLLLARQIERQAETSLRSALGASRTRIIREFVWQSALLSLTGCAAGVVLAWWCTPLLWSLSPMADRGFGFGGFALNEFNLEVAVNLPALLVAATVTVVIGFGAGFSPAWRSSRQINLQSALKGTGRSATLDRGARRTLGTLVVAEIAVALVLLVATSLMARSFTALVNRPWGLATENRLALDIAFSDRVRPQPAQRLDYAQQAMERLAALPGVESVSASTAHPLDPALAAVTAEGVTPPENPGYFVTNHRLVFPNYFKNLGIELKRGREFEAADREGSRLVVVVSESFAARFWPGQDPIGKRVKRGGPASTQPWLEVVGVVADTRRMETGFRMETVGHWYLPYAQQPALRAPSLSITLATAVAPESLETAVRAKLAEIDGNLAPRNFLTFARTIDETYLQDRFALLLVSLFGVVGLVLAVVGLYGLLSFQLTLRTREFGVRAALGATEGRLVALVLRQAGVLVAVGLFTGIAAALAVSRLLGSQLSTLNTTDPLAYVAAATALALVAGLASWIPARRAAKADPMVALRAE